MLAKILRGGPETASRMAPHEGLASSGRAIAVGLAASAALISGIAAADSLRFVYEAPAECPGGEAFAAAVRAQTKSATLVIGGDGSLENTDFGLVFVRITRAESHLHGRLSIEEPGREASVREVTATTCEEVVSALALMTALAIDADLSARPPAAPPTAAAPPPKAAGKTPIPSPAAKNPAPASQLKNQNQRSPQPRAPAAPTPWPGPRWGLGAHAGAFGALAPSLAWGAVSFLDRSAWNTTGEAWSLRLGLALAESPSIGLAEGTATFRWIVARASACPLAVAAGPLTARPCLGIDAGALRGLGSGDKITKPLEETRGWLAATGLGRLQLHLGEGVYLEAEGGFTLPFIRDRFVFVKPRRDIHAVPPLSGFTTAGLGVVLP